MKIYQQLWAEAMSFFESGTPQVDPHLTNPEKDLRRGVTLAFRPSPVVIENICPFLNQLVSIAPEQHAFAQKGLGDLLDRRYKITSAHMTIMRFSRQETDWQQLAALLTENRVRDFGEMEANRMQLIWGDWYASTKTVRILQGYHLPDTTD